MSSSRNVTRFFVTKVAQEPEHIDPGAAAIPGLAFAGGVLSSKVAPLVASTLFDRLGLGETPIEWHGDPVSGLSQVSDIFDPALSAKGANEPKKILNLFDVQLTPSWNKLSERQKQVAALTAMGREQDAVTLVQNMSPEELEGIKLPYPLRPPGHTKALAGPEDWEYLQNHYPIVDDMIVKNKLPEKGVKLNIGGGSFSKVISGPSYDPLTKTIKAPWINQDYLLHEIGHAAHSTKPLARGARVIRDMLHSGVMAAVPMAYIAGNEIKKMFPGEIDDKVIDFVQKNAPSLVTGTWLASEMYPEIQANVRAISHVHKTQGAEAAIKTFKNLMPFTVKNMISFLPVLIGASLAKKYFYEAHHKNEAQKKTAGILGEMWDTVRPIGADIADVGRQIAGQAGKLVDQPISSVKDTLYEAVKQNIKSPEFAYGAVMAGIPSAALAFVHHNTPHGKIYRAKRTHLLQQMSDPATAAQREYEWLKEKEHHDSITWPFLVGLGAAISGGFLNKMFSDLGKVL